MSPEREKKMPFVVATYVYASSQGQRTHSVRTNFGHSCLGLGMVVGDQEWLAVQVFACQQTQELGDLQSLVSVDPGWTPGFLGL